MVFTESGSGLFEADRGRKHVKSGSWLSCPTTSKYA